MRKPIAEIRIGERHRADKGDLRALADSIREQGLLQPIGISEDGELVFGERRLLACRDFLGWKTIFVRIVKVTSIAAGEYAENEMRKNFTVTERLGIHATIDRQKLEKATDTTGSGNSRNCGTDKNWRQDAAAKLAGFGSQETVDRATFVVKRGAPELVAAMDEGVVSIAAAAELAVLPPDEQREIVGSPQTGADCPCQGAARTPHHHRERAAAEASSSRSARLNPQDQHRAKLAPRSCEEAGTQLGCRSMPRVDCGTGTADR